MKRAILRFWPEAAFLSMLAVACLSLLMPAKQPLKLADAAPLPSVIALAAPVTSDAIDAVLAAAPPTGCVIHIPAGKFTLTRSITIGKYNTTLAGQCASHPMTGQAATELVFPPGVPGIVVEGRPVAQGERCAIRGLCLSTTHKQNDAPVHGITVRGTRTNIRDCSVYGFAGHGCMIAGSVAAGTNCNLSSLEHSTFARNGGSGLYILGDNANVCDVAGCSFEENTGWGTYEEGTSGNNYRACHTAANLLGPYCVLTAGPSTFVGCYSEKGQPAAWVGSGSIIVGRMGAGVDLTPRGGNVAGQYIAAGPHGLQISLLEAMILNGLPKPSIPGVGGQIVLIGTWGAKSLVWQCQSPGNWIQRLQ